jgi:hypothetical protein
MWSPEGWIYQSTPKLFGLAKKRGANESLSDLSGQFSKTGQLTMIIRLFQGDVAADSGAYRYGFASLSTSLQSSSSLRVLAFGFAHVVLGGSYILVVSTFERKLQCPFTIRIECEDRFTLEPVPAEGAGMFRKDVDLPWYASTRFRFVKLPADVDIWK